MAMDFEFDKEIDALLRQTARGETAFAAANPKSVIQNPNAVHLDADEISAFAENALPEKSRQKYVLHLADCEKCRKNLSDLILLNSETISETIRVEEKQIIPTAIPWYRKLFAFPNLAYTLGALILVFSGIAAWTVLQNTSNLQNAEISQVSERQMNGKGMSSDGDAAAAVEFYPSNAMPSNTMMNSNMLMMSNSAAMNMNSNSAANFSLTPSAPVATANANASARKESDKDLKDEPKTVATESADSAKTANDSISAGAPPPPKPQENNFSAENEAQKQAAQNSIAQNQTNITPDSRNARRAPSTALLSENKSKKLDESRNDAREKSNETISVGGKTFKRTNNVWYDSTYKGQPTTNITRGTTEYRKLDSGLRGIAENLGGTVVVVWKQKVYRIQ